MTNCRVSQLVRMLETTVGKPVIDETGLTGKYDFKMSYDRTDPQSVVYAPRKLGFGIEPARRSVEFLVVARSD